MHGAWLAALLLTGSVPAATASPDQSGACAALAAARRDLADARRGADADRTVEAFLALRQALEAAGQLARSQEAAESALRLEEKRAVRRPSKQADILYYLGTRLTQERPTEAIPYLSRAVTLAEAEPCREALMLSGLGVAQIVVNDKKPSRRARAAAVAAFDRLTAILREPEPSGAVRCPTVRLDLFGNAAKAYDALARSKAAAAWADVFSVMDQDHLALKSPQVIALLPDYVKHLRAIHSPELARFAALSSEAQAAAVKPASPKAPSCE